MSAIAAIAERLRFEWDTPNSGDGINVTTSSSTFNPSSFGDLIGSSNCQGKLCRLRAVGGEITVLEGPSTIAGMGVVIPDGDIQRVLIPEDATSIAVVAASGTPILYITWRDE